MRYKIATASSAKDLENAVYHLMENGYKPLGSHVVVFESDDKGNFVFAEYSQTMIKDDDNAKAS